MEGSRLGQSVVGGPLVQLLGVALVHNHCGVARGLVGEYWAAGLVRLRREMRVGGEGMIRPAPSQEPRAQVGVAGHRVAWL